MTKENPVYAEGDVARKTPLRPLTPEEQAQVASQRDIAQEWIDLLETVPLSREIALAKTKIEEALFWAVKGLTT